jgi:hypothetical protein
MLTATFPLDMEWKTKLFCSAIQAAQAAFNNIL